MANTFLELPVAAGNGSGASVDCSAFGKVRTISVGGTFRGALNIEISNDGGTTWSVIATFYAQGKETVDVAAQYMRTTRVGVPTIAPGTPSVDVGSTDDGTTVAALPAPTGDGNGSTVDVSALPTYKTVVCGGTWRGNVQIQISNDAGTTWSTWVTFDRPGHFSGECVADRMRVRRVGTPVNSPGQPDVDVAGVSSGGGGGGGASTLTVTSTKTATYTAAIGELVLVDPSGGGFTVDLPTAVGVDGQQIVVKNVTSSSNAVTIDGNGAETIDGSATATLNIGYASYTLVSDGTNWVIV